MMLLCKVSVTTCGVKPKLYKSRCCSPSRASSGCTKLQEVHSSSGFMAGRKPPCLGAYRHLLYQIFTTTHDEIGYTTFSGTLGYKLTFFRSAHTDKNLTAFFMAVNYCYPKIQLRLGNYKFYFIVSC